MTTRRKIKYTHQDSEGHERGFMGKEKRRRNLPVFNVEKMDRVEGAWREREDRKRGLV